MIFENERDNLVVMCKSKDDIVQETENFHNFKCNVPK